LTYSGTAATLEQVIQHEIGHALGLADDSDPNSIMYYELTANNPTLDSTDIAGIQALYAAMSGSSAGTSTGTSALTSSTQAWGLGSAQTGSTETSEVDRQLSLLISSMASFNPPSSASFTPSQAWQIDHHAVLAASAA